MKAILEFDLPTDYDTYKNVMYADDMASALWNIDQALRRTLKDFSDLADEMKDGRGLDEPREFLQSLRDMIPQYVREVV